MKIKTINKQFSERTMLTLFAIVIASVVSSVLYGYINSTSDAALGIGTYILLLCICCSSPLFFVRNFNGKHLILAVFSAFYFIVFAMADLNALVFPENFVSYARRDLVSKPEWLIIAGIVAFIAGYWFISKLHGSNAPGYLTRDWAFRPAFILGGIFWIVGLYVSYIWQFHIAETRGASGEGGFNFGYFAGVISLIRNLQPFGTMLMVYLALSHKSRSAWVALTIMIIVDFFFGFLADSKELSMRSPILLVLGIIVLRNKFPYMGVLALFFAIGLSWSMFATYRLEVLQLGEQTRTAAAASIGNNIKKVLDSDEIGDAGAGLQGFLNRINLKGNVELIVRETGKSVDYQNGYTLSIILYAFIPRYFAPNKPDTSVGQLFNREFKVSEDPNTFISTSHLGELYWNNGWWGAVLGMLVIGMFLGFVGSAVRLDIIQTIPKFVLILATVYFLCLRFEGGIGQQYTLWARLVAVFLLLHLIMPKKNLRHK